MRVAVTGADGFTGRYLCNVLRARGVETVSLTADLADANAVEAEVLAKPFDRLVHLAAQAFVGSNDWRGFYLVNQLGTYNVLDSVARHYPGARCVLASSAQVYGPQASGLIGEDASPAPSNPYAVSKYAMELGAGYWADRLNVLVMRPFNYTGVGQEDVYLIPKIVSHFRRKASVIELGNLDVRRDFGDVRSVADAYAGLVLDSDATTTVNICSGTVHGLRDVLAMASEITGHVVDVQVNPAFVRKNDVPLLGGNPARLQSLLPAWQPRALSDTLRWMLEAPERS
jgi:GDP-6-deoxy-D-talose 4-dehydrogenase